MIEETRERGVREGWGVWKGWRGWGGNCGGVHLKCTCVYMCTFILHACVYTYLHTHGWVAVCVYLMIFKP